MNSQQLQEARQALWHQDGKPLTTLDDAQAWLGTVGICLWLPRGAQFAAPMPSFVEACAGAGSVTPGREAVTHASELLSRLVESGAAIPLNLLGTNIGVEGERADFIVASSALSYVYALRGAKPWKGAPPTGGAGRVSTLSLRVWEALQTHDTMELSELRVLVGHDVSDAGVLRALGELWSSLRAIPIPQIEGKPARWQLLSRRFSKQLNAGSSMGQAAALSAMISLYLDSVIAASTEEIEAALSPLVARSRVGEVVRALEANRQIEFTAVGGALLMHFSGVEEHLPPPIEIVLPPSTLDNVTAGATGPKKYTPREPRPERSSRARHGAGHGVGRGAARETGQDTGRPRTFAARRGGLPAGEPRGGDRTTHGARPSFSRGAGASDRPARKPFGDRSQFKPRPAGGGDGEKRRPSGGERVGPPRSGTPFRPRVGADTKSASRPFSGARSDSGRSSGAPRERASSGPRAAGGARAAGGDGERRSFSPREGRAPFKTRAEEGAPRRSFGGSRDSSRERGPYKPRSDAGRRRSFDRPAGGRREGSSFGASREPSSDTAKRFGPARSPREGGERRPFRRDGEAGARPRSEGGKSFAPGKRYGGKAGGFSKSAGKFAGKPGNKFGAGRPVRERVDRSERAERPERPERQARAAGERRPWQNRPSGGPGPGRSAAGGSERAVRPAGGRPAGGRPANKSFGAKRPSFGKSTLNKSAFNKSRGKPFADRPRSAGASGTASSPGGEFKKRNAGPGGAGPRKAGGFSKSPGGARRGGGGIGKKPGGFGKRPGGFSKRSGGGKPGK